MKHELFTKLDLHLFDGEGAAPGGATLVGTEGHVGEVGLRGLPGGINGPGRDAPGLQGEPGVMPGSPLKETNEINSEEEIPSEAVDAREARKAGYEQLKAQHKDEYDADVQQHLKHHTKKVKELEAQIEQSRAFSPVIDMLSSKYGVDGKDAKALLEAVEKDDGFFEDAAFKAGLSVEQYKHLNKMERENAELHRAEQERKREQHMKQTYARWHEQAEDCKRRYPSFDLKTESTSPESGERFTRLLGAGIDVKTAFEVIHREEILGGAMQHTARVVQEKTINDIRTRGMRPAENGGGNGAATPVKVDPGALSKQQREELAKRARNGERITFSQ